MKRLIAFSVDASQVEPSEFCTVTFESDKWFDYSVLRLLEDQMYAMFNPHYSELCEIELVYLEIV